MRINSLQEALSYTPDIDAYWDSTNLPGTEHQILSMLPANWATTWSSETVELLTQLARAQMLQGKTTEARATLTQAQQMLAETAAKLDARSQIRWNLEQGRMLCLSMNPAKANDLFVAAWNLATESNEPFFAIEAALMLSTVRPPKFQNEWLMKALDLTEQSTDSNCKLWLSHLLFLQGWHLFDICQFDKALAAFERAIDVPIPRNGEPQRRALVWSQARTLRALDRVAEALEIQENLKTAMTRTGFVSGHVYLEVAECKQLLNQKEEAKEIFEQAHTALSADGWYSDNKKSELERMRYLAKKR